MLATYEQTSSVILSYWEFVKKVIREWLGPEIPNYYILADGTILPTTVRLPSDYEFDSEVENYIYYSETKRIANLRNISMEGRFRPLPFIGLQINLPNETVDISDWLGEVRVNPNTMKLSVKQILMLWFLTQSRFVPLEKATIHLVKADGSEEDLAPGTL